MNMAMRNKFAQQYANNFVETAVSEATPHKLVEMLYDGALKNLNLTKVFIEQKNYEKKAEFSNKALSIINALRAGVDMEKGRDVAGNLYDLYDYCYRRVLEASTKNDTVIIDEVIEHIKTLSDAWKEMPETIKRSSKEQIERLRA
ncbi:flagellar export chaperone FliS [Thiomicrorhabdus sp.]|jgi:flagellar protein FliS|uniref:flagellar export chaperone FliS n=1 Tax=Thiomicrorhabdus sp. TaxID=2039724 RepID=UPI00356797D5